MKGWWVILTDYFLTTFEKYLKEIGLYRTIKAVQYEIPTNHFHFCCLLELYNPDTGMLSTPCYELGLALYEIYEVSGLSIGEIPYEEYVFIREELHLLRAQYPLIYDIYWELLCHYDICSQMTGLHNHGMSRRYG